MEKKVELELSEQDGIQYCELQAHANGFFFNLLLLLFIDMLNN